MSYWEILTPEPRTTNLMLNPSAEGTAVYALSTSVVGFSNAHSFKGVASFSVATGGTVNEGTYFSLGSALAEATHYVSAYGYSTPSGWQWSLDNANWVTPTALRTEGSAWVQYGASFSTGEVNGGTILYMRSTSDAAQTWYVDAIQVEQNSYVTTYFDGDELGCQWNGQRHASYSVRPANVRSGGRVRDLQGYYGHIVNAVTGFGNPPVQHSSLSRAQLDGATYLSSRTTERQIQMALTAPGASLANLHSLRYILLNDLKPDLVWPKQPFVLRYTGAGRTVGIPVWLDAGGEGGEIFGFSEKYPLRFLALDDPYWTEEREGGAVLSNSATLAVEQMVAYKPNQPWSSSSGYWDALGAPELTVAGALTAIDAFGRDSKGNLFVGGSFLNLNGVADADFAAYRTPGGTWTALSATVPNNVVYAFTVAADDTVYMGGAFTDLGDAAGDGIVKWTASGGWVSLGAPVANSVYCIAIGLDGSVYIGGTALNIGGVAAADYIAKWNGTVWSALGTGANEAVYKIVIAPNGDLYASGIFTSMGGISNTAYIAKWNGSAWSALGTGANGNVYTLSLDRNGNLYAGGTFTTIGGISASKIAKWNGQLWSALGTGLNSTVYEIVCKDQDVIVGGAFTTAGGFALADRVAVWNGSTWRGLPIDLPGSATVYAIYVDGYDYYLGFDTEGNATISGLSANPVAGSITNPSSAASWPIIEIKRSGGTTAKAEWLKNETTGQALYFNVDLQDGETIEIDLRPGKKSLKSLNNPARKPPLDNLLSSNYLLPNSDLATWHLAPGQNYVTCYVSSTGAPTITVNMRWAIKHWAADGGAS